MLQSARLPDPTVRTALIGLAAAIAGSLVCVALPSVGLQIAFAVGMCLLVLSIVAMRMKRTLNPAWVVVALVYLVAPVGAVVGGLGLGVSTIALLVAMPAPFVVVAGLRDPDARLRLVRLTPFVVLVLFAGLSLLWSPRDGIGFEKLALLILTGLVPAGYLLVLTTRPERIAWWLVAVAAMVLAISVIVLGERSPLYPDRVSVFGDNPIWTARALFIGALVMLFGPFPWVARLVTVPILVVAGLLTASLGPAVGLVIGTLAGVTVALHEASRARRTVRPAAVVVTLLCSLAIVVAIADALGGGRSLTAQVFGNDPNVVGRATLLATAVPMFLASPLEGMGLGGFAVSGLATYPHNLVVEIGTELGILGLAAYGAWLLVALVGASRSPLVMALVVATALFSLFSGSLASNVEFWLFTAIAVAIIPIRRDLQRAVATQEATDESRLDVVARAT